MILQGDCVEVMAGLEPESVDAIVTDPPYGLDFMGKHWDSGAVAFDVATWAEALRVLKPGGYLLAFGGTRTFHRLTVAIEDAGFEIRDCLSWMYGSGFPKSLDVSKAIDKRLGAERPVVGMQRRVRATKHGQTMLEDDNYVWQDEYPATAPATAWAGWGTALKPAWEPIIMARKPLIGTVATNVLAHGTGAINVDGCRVGDGGGTRAVDYVKKADGRMVRWGEGYRGARNKIEPLNLGRWPANVVLDPEAAALLDEQSGERGGSGRASGPTLTGGNDSVARGHFNGTDIPAPFYGDTGGASRFFYTAKADSAERSAGLGQRNTHPTVKPVSLMSWLVMMVTPPGGTVLDPFLGSGTTAIAAVGCGFNWIGIEREAEYVDIARQRLGLFAA